MKHAASLYTCAAIVCAIASLCGQAANTASAADAPSVFVTIADAQGQLAVARQAVTVTDTDADGALTLSDALFAAHEAYYPGGAAEGFATVKTDFGTSLAKLWGDANGSSYGYCINNAFANSLADPIASGDAVCAYVYTDLATWSDEYCFFDVATLDGDAADSFTLTLSGLTYDASWSPITEPIAGAYLTFDGVRNTFRTDANGTVTFSLPAGASVVISAESDDKTLVPPVCIATQTVQTSTTAQTTLQTTTTTSAAPQTTAAPASATGDAAPILPLLTLCLVAVGGCALRRSRVHR